MVAKNACVQQVPRLVKAHFTRIYNDLLSESRQVEGEVVNAIQRSKRGLSV